MPPVVTPNSAGGFRVSIDASDFRRLATTIGKIRHALPAVEKTEAQFGAYMYYSRYLELGTKNPDGSTRMAARPHILPAVSFLWDGYILPNVGKGMGNILAGIFNGSMSDLRATEEYSRVWLRTLNDAPRRAAVARAPYLYGFHRRSIRGYINDPDQSAINAEIQAARDRYRLNPPKRTKKGLRAR